LEGIGNVYFYINDRFAVQCPNDKCDGGEAFFYQLQIRSADEPMTSFFKVRMLRRNPMSQKINRICSVPSVQLNGANKLGKSLPVEVCVCKQSLSRITDYQTIWNTSSITRDVPIIEDFCHSAPGTHPCPSLPIKVNVSYRWIFRAAGLIWAVRAARRIVDRLMDFSRKLQQVKFLPKR
jgi:hypothetical protein